VLTIRCTRSTAQSHVVAVRPEIEALEVLNGRDLSHWKEGNGAQARR
jgi:hypothetical protein